MNSRHPELDDQLRAPTPELSAHRIRAFKLIRKSTSVKDLRSPLDLPLVAAVTTAVLGILVLVGWGLAIPSLRSVLPGAVEMKANTAIGLILASIALFLLNYWRVVWQVRVAQALALAVCLLGLATFAEYVFGWQLHIDELL